MLKTATMLTTVVISLASINSFAMRVEDEGHTQRKTETTIVIHHGKGQGQGVVGENGREATAAHIQDGELILS